MKTFVFEARPQTFVPLHLPGQFLTFEFEIDGETIHRCYTITSSPARPYRISITVKRTPGGPVSNWLHETLRPGAAVRVSGPMGEIHLRPPSGPQADLLSRPAAASRR